MEQWQCTDFAHMLLSDDVVVRKYEKEYKEKDLFVREVLKDWLSRNDDDATDLAVPRTWSALAECITDAGLPGALTKAINDACPPQGTVYTCTHHLYVHMTCNNIQARNKLWNTVHLM